MSENNRGSVHRGYTAIGLMRPKNRGNVGSVMRAAFCYGAAMVAIEGIRTTIEEPQDSHKAWRNMPVLRGDDMRAMVPYDAIPVAVDLVKDAENLISFQHPQRAFYIFGPEDGTLDDEVLSWCRHRLMVPTRVCMNLAASVNVVLYDRMAKIERNARHIKYSGLGLVA